MVSEIIVKELQVDKILCDRFLTPEELWGPFIGDPGSPFDKILGLKGKDWVERLGRLRALQEELRMVEMNIQLVQAVQAARLSKQK